MSAGERVPDADLWRPGESFIRFYDCLRHLSMSLFVYVAADRLDAERALIRALMEAHDRTFAGGLARFILIDEGLPEEVKAGAEVLVDHKRQFASALGAVHGSILLIRPDGYLAFHRSSWAPEKIAAGVGLWLVAAS